jgi:hypothetical protein
VVVSYSSNSEPNPVTEKSIREENERYFFWQNGKLVTLTLSLPYGADNADQWDLMSLTAALPKAIVLSSTKPSRRALPNFTS